MASTAPDGQPTQQRTPDSEEPELVEVHEDEKPTASHELASIEQDDKGMAQIEHGDVEVKNLGWNEESKNVPRPLVGGLSNEELWTLIRRFNKQIFCVKSITEVPVSESTYGVFLLQFSVAQRLMVW
jgi:hypothetical protein